MAPGIIPLRPPPSMLSTVNIFPTDGVGLTGFFPSTTIANLSDYVRLVCVLSMYAELFLDATNRTKRKIFAEIGRTVES